MSSNSAQITSLYRQSLRLAKSWLNKRDLYRQKALEIRYQFDQNAEETDPRRIHALVSNTQVLLKKYQHPDPIIPPQRPGGTKWERNVPPPTEERKFCSYYIFEIRAFFSIRVLTNSSSSSQGKLLRVLWTISSLPLSIFLFPYNVFFIPCIFNTQILSKDQFMFLTFSLQEYFLKTNTLVLTMVPTCESRNLY